MSDNTLNYMDRDLQNAMSFAERSPKTVNNVLTTLNVLLKTAVEWGVIERAGCSVKLLKTPKTTVPLYDFEEYERLLGAARSDATTYLMALLGGEAGLRCGEIKALEWTDIDLKKRQLCVAGSEWNGRDHAEGRTIAVCAADAPPG